MRHLLCEATGPVVGRACDDLLTPAIAKLAAPSIATLAADPRATSSGEEAPSGACYCLASFYTLLCEWAAKEAGGLAVCFAVLYYLLTGESVRCAMSCDGQDLMPSLRVVQ